MNALLMLQNQGVTDVNPGEIPNVNAVPVNPIETAPAETVPADNNQVDNVQQAVPQVVPEVPVVDGVIQ